MAERLSGKDAALALQADTIRRVQALRVQYIFPVLAIIRVGERTDDLAYERGILSRCEACGVIVRRYILPQSVTQQELAGLLDELNQNKLIHGVLLLRPLPKEFDEAALCNRLVPEKDVDGMTERSAAGVYLARPVGFAPCTPSACMQLLSHYGIACAGAHAVVVGRSTVVGKPLALLLLAQSATVTVCHSKTKDLAAVCRQADILISACGQKKLINAAYVKPGAAVLDVGIHWDEETQKLCGDVDFDAVTPVAGAITPVPGGVGSVTAAMLALHVVQAAERTLK